MQIVVRRLYKIMELSPMRSCKSSWKKSFEFTYRTWAFDKFQRHFVFRQIFPSYHLPHYNWHQSMRNCSLVTYIIILLLSVTGLWKYLESSAQFLKHFFGCWHFPSWAHSSKTRCSFDGQCYQSLAKLLNYFGYLSQATQVASLIFQAFFKRYCCLDFNGI